MKRKIKNWRHGQFIFNFCWWLEIEKWCSGKKPRIVKNVLNVVLNTVESVVKIAIMNV